MITQQQRSICKLVAICLQYPNENYKLEVESLDQVIAELDLQPAKQLFLDFLSFCGQTPLLRLQEEYSRTFDLSPSASLNLSYHKWRDGRQRGQALAKLQRAYLEEGYEPAGGELPDYLPLMLEFLSVCAQRACLEIIREYKAEVATLAGYLRKDESPYGVLLEIVEKLFDNLNGGGDKR